MSRPCPQERSRWRERITHRYAGTSTLPWLFAYWKLRLDPLFGSLEALLRGSEVRCALDIGCGFGIPGAALQEWFPQVDVYGIDPLADRARTASVIFGAQGAAVQAAAPEISVPAFPQSFDLVMMLDVAQFLIEEELMLTLQRIRERLGGGGRLLMRVIIPPEIGCGSFFWHFAALRRRIVGPAVEHRSLEGYCRLLNAAGFQLERSELSEANPELAWLLARVDAAA